jgi:hypothetical protein
MRTAHLQILSFCLAILCWYHRYSKVMPGSRRFRQGWSHQLMTLPLAQPNFKAALPLVPGLVRTSDGRLYIKGTPEEQGLLLVDGADMVDPRLLPLRWTFPSTPLKICKCTKALSCPIQPLLRRSNRHSDQATLGRLALGAE